MGYSDDGTYTTGTSDHSDRSGLKDVNMEATRYSRGSSHDEEQHDSPGGNPPLVSECDRTIESTRPEIDHQKAAARTYAPQYSRKSYPRYAPYAPGAEGPGAPALQHYSMQALPQVQQYHAHAHAHARQYPAHAHPRQYPAHAHAPQYPAPAHPQRYPSAQSGKVPPSSNQYPAAPQKGVFSLEEFASRRAQATTRSAAPSRAPSIYGQPMPPEITAAYEILARAKQNPLPNPNAAPVQPGWPQFAPPPGAQSANPYYYPPPPPPRTAHPSAYHMPAPSTSAPIPYPHGYPTDLHYAGSAPHRPSTAGAHSYPSQVGKVVSSPLLSLQKEDKVSDENFSALSVGEGESKPKKRARKERKHQNPVYATLSKETMIEIMEKYGPIVWYSGAKRPYLDWEKERTLFALRQIFFRWNPNFTDDFYYSKETGTWMPIRGEQYEIARRVEIRRQCHVETRGLRNKMYEKRRNGPRANWKTHTSRYYMKVQNRCYRSNAEKESNAKKELNAEKERQKQVAQQSDDGGERHPVEDEEGVEKV
jgi:hypothetical protein